jgi:hypothetical protein
MVHRARPAIDDHELMRLSVVCEIRYLRTSFEGETHKTDEEVTKELTQDPVPDS